MTKPIELSLVSLYRKAYASKDKHLFEMMFSVCVFYMAISLYQQRLGEHSRLQDFFLLFLLSIIS